AYVANNVNDSARYEVRLKTYLAFLEKVGRPEEIIDLNTSVPAEERVQSIKNYITRHGCPDAILCQNDEGAIHTYQAVTGLGYRIPEDVLLVGCDGLPFLEYFGTPLSTIALPMEEICETASRFLQNRMAESDIPIQRAVVPAHLVVRKSLSLDA
ncbi:LacI family transcriptional regulator, partial [bacterium]